MVGRDGTTYASAFGPWGEWGTDEGLALFVGDGVGDLESRALVPPARSDRAWSRASDRAGADVEVAPDGTVWVLHRPMGRVDAGLFRCADVACTTWDSATVPGVSHGQSTLAIDDTGRPMIATVSPRDGAVQLLSCRDQDCTAVDPVVLAGLTAVPEPVSEEDSWWPVVSMTLDDGRPVVTTSDPHARRGEGGLVLRCRDARCGAD